MEEILTSDFPAAVQHQEDFFQLREALGALGARGLADVPGVCGVD